MTQDDMEILYPNIGKRIKAVLVDSVLFITVIVTILPVLAKIEYEYTWLKIFVLYLPFFVLDPLLVSLTGGSIGHHAFKIRVRSVHKDQNIDIVFAMIRSFLKTVLGSLSIVLILFTRKHQAFHDLATRSIVVMKYSDQLSSESGLRERAFHEEGYIYPSKLRRFVVIFAYSVLIYVMVSIVSCFFVSEPCFENDKCTQKDEVITLIYGLLWIIGTISIIYKGIRAQLFGCRRVKIDTL